MNKNKVLILSNICAGGVETFSIYLSRQLKILGFEVYFINQNEIKKDDNRFSKSLEKILTDSDIPIISSNQSLEKEYFEEQNTFLIPFYATQYLNQFYNTIKEKNTLPKVLGYIHSDGAYYYDNAFLYAAITNRFISVSETANKKMEELLSSNEKVIFKRCPLLITANKSYHKGEKTISLLFVGRISNESKGVYKLIEIAKYLEDENIKYHLNIVGNGPDLNELKNRFTNANLINEVIFTTDADTPDKVKSFYEKADVLLILSSYEGGPLVLYEGMEFGVIPVSFNVGTVSSIVENNKCGYVFEHNEFNKLKNQIKIISRKRSLVELKKAAQSRIRKLDMGIEEYGIFISDLINNPIRQHADVAIRQTESKINWKSNDFKSWILKILSETECKRNYMFHYLYHNNKIELNKQQNHYNSVYEDMPKWWKKFGGIIRKFSK